MLAVLRADDSREVIAVADSESGLDGDVDAAAAPGVVIDILELYSDVGVATADGVAVPSGGMRNNSEAFLAR